MVFGILVVTLVGCVVTGGVLALVFLRREAKLSKLQLDFVSKVSHELRTPLTSIRMFTEMLQSEDRSEAETETCLNVLQQETTRLWERIERLLDWGRMEAGRRVYDLSSRRSRRSSTRPSRRFGASQLGQQVEVALEVPDDLPCVMADRHALVDALVNLLPTPSNTPTRRSANHCERPGRRPRVRLAVQRPRDRHSARRALSHLPEVLPPRRALRGTWKDPGSASRSYATWPGGTRPQVEVESEPGHGSMFTIVIPVPTPSAQRKPLSATPPREAEPR